MWLNARGWPAGELLVKAGLPASPSLVPNRLVSLHAYMRLIGRLAKPKDPTSG
jgi:hypothetical protein